ncbi:putative nuclease harbi1 [Plakobranchus ocellatus]|uniref:Nuclease harbi1 n=1 Tax=Plakobranchus ocellatus TaxID=259542 RepID=A0AAV3YE51_9GAST|nr:putative nuclease harbi1 [Plakobranchus ocellatus]
MTDTIKALASEAIVVTERQLCDFVKGGKYDSMNVNDVVREEIRHCPLNNLIGESSFGDFDYDLSKRRHASLHNRSAVHVIKRNKTMKFLNKKSVAQQGRILSLARKFRQKYRQHNRDLEEKASSEIKRRFVFNQDKKIQKRLAEISKNANIIEAVQKQDGPCRSSQEVDDLLERLRGKSQKFITEAIKNEIRYQKVIAKKKLKFGTLEFMVQTLKNSFDSDIASN